MSVPRGTSCAHRPAGAAAGDRWVPCGARPEEGFSKRAAICRSASPVCCCSRSSRPAFPQAALDEPRIPGGGWGSGVRWVEGWPGGGLAGRRRRTAAALVVSRATTEARASPVPPAPPGQLRKSWGAEAALPQSLTLTVARRWRWNGCQSIARSPRAYSGAALLPPRPLGRVRDPGLIQAGFCGGLPACRSCI